MGLEWAQKHDHKLIPRRTQSSLRSMSASAPCSGLAEGFGSVWLPLCGDMAVGRVDMVTNKLIATIHVGPANSEGGIATSPDVVWMPTDLAAGKLARIDPKTNTVVATIAVAPGSVAVAYAEGAVWVSSPMGSVVTKVDAKTNEVLATIPTGPTPRSITAGGGSVWTPNQGDGTVTPSTRRRARCWRRSRPAAQVRAVRSLR